MENGLNPAVIETFTIRRLHGYKDVSVEFAGAATIVVAENGTGKTTVLNILNAFLTRRFPRLLAFNFSSIECKFVGEMFPLVLTREMLGQSEGVDFSARIQEFCSQANVSEAEMSDFVLRVYKQGHFSDFRHHQIVRQVFSESPLGWEEIEAELEALASSADRSLTDAAKQISVEVKRLGGEVDVVFLPTYRRIERPQLRPRTGREGRRGARFPFQHSRSGNHDDMVFGLADVEERLGELSEEIERRSNLEYRSISARILEEMLKGTAINESVTMADLPDVASLSRFLNRVSRTENRLGGVFTDIDNLYGSRAIENHENWFLRYFLSRLARVIDQTREMEQRVEQFVTVCNSYLTLSSDEKQLSFDPQNLRVVVKDLWADRVISLDALSSGEKQIVSIMAKLHLNKTPKLVLMDEPELSLSLDWQRKLLPDIMQSGSVVQLLAITHSPFIFENELDHCARALKIERAEVGNE